MPLQSRRNQVLMALIAAWLAISLAIGGARADQAVTADEATAQTRSGTTR